MCRGCEGSNRLLRQLSRGYACARLLRCVKGVKAPVGGVRALYAECEGSYVDDTAWRIRVGLTHLSTAFYDLADARRNALDNHLAPLLQRFS